MTAVKVIKVLGTSDDSWQDAAEEAFHEAQQSVDDIQGIEVEEWTADVEDGEVAQYRTTVEVAFPVHDEQRNA